MPATRRLGAALTTGLLTLAVALSAVLGAPAATAKADESRKVGIVTYNIHYTQSQQNAARDIERLSRNEAHDVIAWQEAAKFIPAIQRMRGWSTYVPPGAARQDAVSWRTSDFQMMRATSRRAHDANRSANIQEKGVVEVTLRDRATGHVFTILNVHVNAHIDNGGHGRSGARLNDAQKHFALIKERIQKASGTAFATGDFNVNYFHDVKVRDKRLAYSWLNPVAVSNWKKFGAQGNSPTHGKRYIDYVFTERKALESKDVSLIKNDVLTGFGSDHKPVVTRVSLKAAR